MDAIIIWGAGGHAKVVAQSIRRAGRWRLAGFVDDVTPGRAGEIFGGSRVLGGRETLPELIAQGVHTVALAFWQVQARHALWVELAALGWRFPAIVDPHSTVAEDCELGGGCYVAARAVIQPGARIGSLAIINTGAVVEHDCVVGDGAHVCPGAVLAGHVEVGRGAWVGAGAVVRDRVCIGESAVIGIGSVVLEDVAAGWVAYGHPVRGIRKVQA